MCGGGPVSGLYSAPFTAPGENWMYSGWLCAKVGAPIDRTTVVKNKTLLFICDPPTGVVKASCRPLGLQDVRLAGGEAKPTL